MKDSRNFLSLGGVMYHVLSKESGMNITEETLINLDESAYKLLMERGAIRLTELT